RALRNANLPHHLRRFGVGMAPGDGAPVPGRCRVRGAAPRLGIPRGTAGRALMRVGAPGTGHRGPPRPSAELSLSPPDDGAVLGRGADRTVPGAVIAGSSGVSTRTPCWARSFSMRT